jgi:hypothetical protein
MASQLTFQISPHSNCIAEMNQCRVLFRMWPEHGDSRRLKVSLGEFPMCP